MSDDFDHWNIIKRKAHTDPATCLLRAGEVRWCKFGINIGCEIRGKGELYFRPVLILRKFSGDTFLGIPITTRKKVGDWYYFIKNQNRTLILNQARVLDRKRLGEKIFEISEGQVADIKEQFCLLIKS